MVDDSSKNSIIPDLSCLNDQAKNQFEMLSTSSDAFKKEPSKEGFISPSDLSYGNELLFLNEMEAENKILREQLATSARKANMAEISIGVLHDIGNVLSSVSVSISIMYEKLKANESNELNKISVMLTENQVNIEEYLLRDPKGKHIIAYIKKIASDSEKNKNSIQRELRLLGVHLNHVRSIISMQLDNNASMGAFEPVSVSELIEDSIVLNQLEQKAPNIKVIKDFQVNERVIVDRTRLMQIITNLIKNSIDSVLENNDENKTITLVTESIDESNFMLKVTDNGLGISKKNLKKLFTYGFTTKKDGHGFGLHACFNSAKEMHGSLHVESPGLGLGASFILILPKQQTKK